MKTIKELEKEIEDLELKEKELSIDALYSGDLVRITTKLEKLNPILKQTKEICKMIEEMIKDRKHEMRLYKKPELNEFYARINELKELLKNIKGKKRRKKK